MRKHPVELSEAKEQGFYEISQVSKISGVTSKMIRYYESIGLIPPAKRTIANYRIYNNQDIQALRLIKRSRALGFSTTQIELLLKLWRNPSRASAEVKQLVLSHVDELEQQISEIQKMCTTLRYLAKDCCGNQSPDCPILEELSQLNLDSNNYPKHSPD